MLVILCRGADGAARVMIRRRPDRGLLSGLYEFPHMDGFADKEAVARYLEAVGLPAVCVEPLPEAKHLFTHVEWRMTGFLVRTDHATVPEGWLAVTCAELEHETAVPSAFRVYRNCCITRMEKLQP